MSPVLLAFSWEHACISVCFQISSCLLNHSGLSLGQGCSKHLDLLSCPRACDLPSASPTIQDVHRDSSEKIRSCSVSFPPGCWTRR